MINALVLFKMDAWVTDEMKESFRSTTLANAKQIVCGTLRDDAILDIAATTVNDLNGALARLSEVKGVKSATVVRLIAGS
jgi:hypothetical protein